MATPLIDSNWEVGARQLTKYGMVVCAFFEEDNVPVVQRSVHRLVNGPDVVPDGCAKSLFRNGVLSHASAFHGAHRVINARVFNEVLRPLLLDTIGEHQRLQMLPFQVHARENSHDTIGAWSFTKTPGVLSGDRIYLSFINLNSFNMFIDVVPSSHTVVSWGGLLQDVTSFTNDPFDIQAYQHLVFTPCGLSDTLEDQKQTVAVPPGHVFIYASNLVTSEPYTDEVDAARPSLYFSMACRVTDSDKPMYHTLLTDLEKQQVPTLHTGEVPTLFPVNDPFNRPGFYRDLFGTKEKPLMYVNDCMVEWHFKTMRPYFPNRIANGLGGTSMALDPYTDWEISLFTGDEKVREMERDLLCNI